LSNLDAVYDLTLAFKIPWLPLKAKQLGPSLLGKYYGKVFFKIFLAQNMYVFKRYGVKIM